MSNRLVYASGPMFRCDHREVFSWRYEAKVLLGPENVVDPADRICLTGEENLSKAACRRLVEEDLVDLHRCDAVLAHIWKPSFGTSMELWEAFTHRKLIAVVSVGPTSAWVRHVSDYLTDSLSDACRFLATELGLEGVPCRR
jgi:hypothetical protein